MMKLKQRCKISQQIILQDKIKRIQRHSSIFQLIFHNFESNLLFQMDCWYIVLDKTIKLKRQNCIKEVIFQLCNNAWFLCVWFSNLFFVTSFFSWWLNNKISTSLFPCYIHFGSFGACVPYLVWLKSENAETVMLWWNIRKPCWVVWADPLFLGIHLLYFRRRSAVNALFSIL